MARINIAKQIIKQFYEPIRMISQFLEVEDYSGLNKIQNMTQPNIEKLESLLKSLKEEVRNIE